MKQERRQRSPESGKVLQERLTDILTEMAESQTFPLSPKEASHGQKSAWLMPPPGWAVPLAGRLLGAGQRA